MSPAYGVLVAPGMCVGRRHGGDFDNAPGVRGLSVAAMVATGMDVAGIMPPAYRVIRAVVLHARASDVDC